MDNFGLNVSQEAAQHILAILGGLMSPNNQERGAAEEQYHGCKTENPDQMLATLLYLAAFSSEMPIRSMAALMFRKEVGIPGKEDEFWTWKQASPQAQMIIKAALLNILQQDHPDDVRRKLGDGLSSLAITVLTLEDNSWPELLPFLLNLSEKEKPEVRSTALEVLGAMANRIPEAIEGHFDSFIPFLQQKLNDPSTKVRVSCFLLIYGLLSFAIEEPPKIQKMQSIGGPVLEAISACLHASDFESGSLAMEYLVEMVELCPKFLRPNIFMMIDLMFKITKSEQLEDSIRHLAVESMVTLAESKPGMVRKIPNFLEGIVGLLLEWGTLLEDNEDWNKGEAEDLEDTEAAVAEESIDRLSIAMGGPTVVPVLFSALPALLSSKEWTQRHSALIAIAVVGEGSKNYLTNHLDKLVSMVLPFGQDPHPRVRWAAMNALAQMCTDFQPDIQLSFGKEILSCVIPVLDDKENPRVQSHAASCVVNFCEDCSKETIMPFCKPILEKLHGLLQSPRIVQEQVITAVAAMADCIKEDFGPFYGYFMPFLKEVLNTATSKEYMLLRAKAMECASIVGVCVGKELFGQDAKEIIELLNKIEFASDPSMPSMHMAWARLCKCLGTDFKPYLEIAMPQLLALASIQPKVEIIDTDRIEEYAEEWEVVPLGDQAMCIKTSEAEDKSTAINIIFCFCDEMGEHFFPYVQPVAELMANSLTFAYHDAVRNTAASCCPCLLLSTIQHLTSTGQGMQPAVELWQYLQPQLIKAIRKEIDTEAHVSMIEAYSECFDLVGEATHNPESLKAAAEAFNKVLKKYFDARKNRSKLRGEGDDDEDFDEFDAEKLEQLIDRDDDVVALIAEMFGKLFKAYGPLYFPHFAPTIPTWKQFLQPGQRERDIQMAMCIFDDMTEHMQEAAAPHVADLFNFYGAICNNGNGDIRQASAFGLGLFAQYGGPAFGQVANNVANALCQVISSNDARSEANVHPTENAISALGKICLYHPDSVELQKFLPAFVSFLPVCEDTEESTVTYSTLAGLLDKHPELVLGSDSSKLPHILHLFGAVLGSDLVNEKGTERIVTSIKRLEAANQKLFQEGCGVLSQEEREKILHASNM